MEGAGSSRDAGVMSRLVTPASALLMVSAYAMNYALTALTIQHVSPFLMLTLRWGMSAIILWAILAVRRTPLPRGRLLLESAGAGILVQGAQFIGTYWAIAHGVGAGMVSLIIAMNPVVTAALTTVVLRRRETRRGLVSLALGLGAVLLACVPRVLSDPRIGPMVLAAVGSLIGLACGSLWQGRRLHDVDPVAFNAIGVSASLPLSLGLLAGERVHLDGGSRTWSLIALIAVIGVIGTTLYSLLVRRLGARDASVLFSVIPAATALAAWIVLSERMGVTALIALVLGAVACALQLGGRHRSESEPRPEHSPLVARQ